MPEGITRGFSPRCVVKWNPGEWPYITRCILASSHQGDHRDNRDRTLPNIPGQVENEAD